MKKEIYKMFFWLIIAWISIFGFRYLPKYWHYTMIIPISIGFVMALQK